MPMLILCVLLLLAVQTAVAQKINTSISDSEYIGRWQLAKAMFSYIVLVLGGVTLVTSACVQMGYLSPCIIEAMLFVWLDSAWIGAVICWRQLGDECRESDALRADLAAMRDKLQKVRGRIEANGQGSLQTEPED